MEMLTFEEILMLCELVCTQVVDVPGDHFSLLRQDAADMTVLVAALKAALAPHGWVEMINPARKPYAMTKVTTRYMASS